MGQTTQTCNTNLSDKAIPNGIAWQPPKNWCDLSADEKIERIRQEVKRMSYQIGDCHQKCNKVENDLKNHAHLGDKVVKDIKTISNELCGSGVSLKSDPKSEEEGRVYF